MALSGELPGSGAKGQNDGHSGRLPYPVQDPRGDCLVVHKGSAAGTDGRAHLGSGLTNQSQKMTVAAMQMAEKKV